MLGRVRVVSGRCWVMLVRCLDGADILVFWLNRFGVLAYTKTAAGRLGACWVRFRSGLARLRLGLGFGRVLLGCGSVLFRLVSVAVGLGCDSDPEP